MKKLAFLLLVFICANSNAQKAVVQILDNVLIELKALTETDTVYQLEDGERTPEGFKLVARGKWKTGPVTVKCSEHEFKNLTVRKAREIGATHYRLFDFKGPMPFINSCYRSKVLFFIRNE